MNYDMDDNASLGYCSDVQFSPESYSMTWTLPNSNHTPVIEFTEEPADYRYRYLKEKYHGHIVGKNSPATKKKDMCKFPKVKIQNYAGSAIVRVWLITTELDKPRAHIHKLARKPPKGVLNLEPHDFIASPQNNFEVTLDYLHIVHAVTNDENDINIYCRKKTHIQSGLYEPPGTIPFSSKDIKDAKDEIKQIDKNQSFFYIQVFDELSRVKIGETVSRKIKNLHNAEFGPLKIVNCSRTFGTCRGDDEVFIFVEKISKDVEVRFFQCDSMNKRIWEAPAIYGPHNVHHQLGIVFRTPKFCEDLEKDTPVQFELHRKSDGSVSDPISYIYKPHEEYKFHDMCKKRPYSPETATSEDEYLPSTVTSFSAKRLKDESTSPESFITSSDEIDTYVNTYNHEFNTLKEEHLYESMLCSYKNTTGLSSPDNLELVDLEEFLKTNGVEFDSVPSEDRQTGTAHSKGIEIENPIEDRLARSSETSESDKTVSELETSPNTPSKNKTRKSSCSKEMLLHSAIYEDRPLSEIKELLKSIFTINTVDYEGNTVLHLAAAKSVECLKILLDRNDANSCLKNFWGDDVMLYATRYGNLMSLRLLLERQFNPNVKNERSGETPLHLALAKDDYSMVELLLEYGADPLINSNNGLSAYEYSLNSLPEIKQMLVIWMQKNIFKDKNHTLSRSRDYCSESDLASKLNELGLSAS